MLALSQHVILSANDRDTLELLWLSKATMLPQKHCRDKEDMHIGLSLWIHDITLLALCLLSTLYGRHERYGRHTSLLVIICLSDLFFKVGKASNGFLICLCYQVQCQQWFIILWYDVYLL